MAHGDHESELTSQSECQCPELWELTTLHYFSDQPRTVVRNGCLSTCTLPTEQIQKTNKSIKIKQKKYELIGKECETGKLRFFNLESELIWEFVDSMHLKINSLWWISNFAQLLTLCVK